MLCVQITPQNISIEEWPEDNHLEFLQKKVGGYFEAVGLTPTSTLWCNEEGKLMHLPVNEMATRLFAHHFGATDIIAGTVIITGGGDEEGNTLGLTVDQAQEIIELASQS